MTISKCLMTVCLIVVCAGFISVHAQDNPAQAAARAALMEKLYLTENGTATAPAEQPAATTEATSTNTASAAAAPDTGDTKAQAAARAALMAKMATTPSQQPAGAGKSSKATGAGFAPMTAPALPISANKEAQLQELTAKYKADQISPEEYQKQRAAILAQP